MVTAVARHQDSSDFDEGIYSGRRLVFCCVRGGALFFESIFRGVRRRVLDDVGCRVDEQLSKMFNQGK